MIEKYDSLTKIEKFFYKGTQDNVILLFQDTKIEKLRFLYYLLLILSTYYFADFIFNYLFDDLTFIITLKYIFMSFFLYKIIGYEMFFNKSSTHDISRITASYERKDTFIDKFLSRSAITRAIIYIALFIVVTLVYYFLISFIYILDVQHNGTQSGLSFLYKATGGFIISVLSYIIFIVIMEISRRK